MPEQQQQESIEQFEKQQDDSMAQLQDQLSHTEERAKKAEDLLTKAKEELLSLSTSAGRERFAKLEQQLAEMWTQNVELTQSLRKMGRQLQDHQREASHWRGRFLLSEIDIVSVSDRAEKAEKKLGEAVKPVPYDQKQLIKERELSWMAFVDPITGLGNANKLDLALKESVTATLVAGNILALFVLDIDKFRQLNAFVGWEQANLVLQNLGHRIQKNVPQGTTLVRRGQDEFALMVILDGPGQGEMGESPLVRCRQIADFLLRLFDTPFKVNYQDYPLKASIGISICPDDADNENELLDNAYSALATAKLKGGSQYTIYSDKVYQDKERRANLAAELKSSLNDDSLLFFFRPVVDVEKGSLAAAIVEPFWEHPSHGRVAQEAFMPLAEEHGLMPAVVKQMIGAGCELSRKLKGSISIIVRCPASILQMAGFAKHFMDAITAARVNPKSLLLELPADCLHTTPTDVNTLFTELGRWGLGCSVHFGEGSPLDLSKLSENQLSVVALSPELMNSVPAQESRRSVVQAYLDVCKRLGVSSLVNGVADSSQAHFLALHQCRWATGDFLSPTLNLSDFINRRRTTWKLR
jgi:diguanylate cyclase (GGDEF)-like protein